MQVGTSSHFLDCQWQHAPTRGQSETDSDWAAIGVEESEFSFTHRAPRNAQRCSARHCNDRSCWAVWSHPGIVSGADCWSDGPSTSKLHACYMFRPQHTIWRSQMRHRVVGTDPQSPKDFKEATCRHDLPANLSLAIPLYTPTTTGTMQPKAPNHLPTTTKLKLLQSPSRQRRLDCEPLA